MDPLKWLIWSNQHGAWWKPHENGYTKDRNAAGRYDLITAQHHVTMANAFLDPDQAPKETMQPDYFHER